MSNCKLDNEILAVLEQLRDLRVAHEESEKAQEELKQFVALLREELKTARDAERASEARRSRAQAFTSQQQEIILKLLAVKEENENLKHTIKKLESTITDIQNSSMAEHVKKEGQIHEIKQDYLKELIRIQEESDAKVIKIRAELASHIEELMKTKAKNEDRIDQQTQLIESLQLEIKELKQRDSVNIDIFQRKLEEQERKHQAELETWKLAELNLKTMQQTPNNFISQHVDSSRVNNSYMSNLVNRQSTNFENRTKLNITTSSYTNKQMNNQISSWQNFNNQQHSLISRPNILPNVSPNIVRPLPRSVVENNQQNKDFKSANELYLQSKNVIGNAEESKHENLERLTESLAHVIQKPKIPVPNKRRKLFSGDKNDNLGPLNEI